MTPTIDIKRAEVHNLKQVSVGIPRNKLVVITGVSGFANRPLPLTPCLQKAKDDMSKAQVPTRDSSLESWINPR